MTPRPHRRVRARLAHGLRQGALAAGLLAAGLVPGVLRAGTAQAQGLALGGGDKPIAITADNGIEWQSEAQRLIARGNAKAVQGDVVVTADALVAYYRPRPKAPDKGGADKGGADQAGAGAAGETAAPLGTATDITRLEAVGHVRITAPGESARADRAVYDMAQAVLVLTGKDLKLATSDGYVTADQSLEYWNARKMAVARGDAVAVKGDRRVQADILTAHLEQDAKTGKTRLRRIDAYGHVVVSSPTESVRGDRGVYNVESGIATLVGSVKITRGDNQLNGGYAEVDLNTGVSRLLGAAPDSRHPHQVEGLLVPSQGAPGRDAPRPKAPPPPAGTGR